MSKEELQKAILDKIEVFDILSNTLMDCDNDAHDKLPVKYCRALNNFLVNATLAIGDVSIKLNKYKEDYGDDEFFRGINETWNYCAFHALSLTMQFANGLREKGLYKDYLPMDDKIETAEDLSRFEYEVDIDLQLYEKFDKLSGGKLPSKIINFVEDIREVLENYLELNAKGKEIFRKLYIDSLKLFMKTCDDLFRKHICEKYQGDE